MMEKGGKIRIQSAGDNARGERSNQQLLTAKNHFNQFLKLHGNQVISLEVADTLLPSEVTDVLLGYFATFLFMNLSKLSDALVYLSQMKCFFAEKWQDARNGVSVQPIIPTSGIPTSESG